jgi:hypothetical protein
MKRGRKWAYFALAVLGALLIELLIENGSDHSLAVRRGPQVGWVAYLGDLLYFPALLIAISAIWIFIDKKVPRLWVLAGVLVVAGLVAW